MFQNLRMKFTRQSMKIQWSLVPNSYHHGIWGAVILVIRPYIYIWISHISSINRLNHLSLWNPHIFPAVRSCASLKSLCWHLHRNSQHDNSGLAMKELASTHLHTWNVHQTLSPVHLVNRRSKNPAGSGSSSSNLEARRTYRSPWFGDC